MRKFVCSFLMILVLALTVINLTMTFGAIGDRCAPAEQCEWQARGACEEGCEVTGGVCAGFWLYSSWCCSNMDCCSEWRYICEYESGYSLRKYTCSNRDASCSVIRT